MGAMMGHMTRAVDVVITRQFPRYRFFFQAGFDAAAWFVGLWIATLLRYDLVFDQVDNWGVARVAAVAALAQIGIGSLAGLYVHRWRYGTFEEVGAVMRVVALVTVLVSLLNLTPLLSHVLPTSATVVAGFLALAVMSLGRMVWRTMLDRWTRAEGDGREPVIVVGAGEGGLQVVTAMLKSGPYHPVAILDDKPDLQNLRLKGVRVMGDRTALPEIAHRLGVRTLVVAIPSASGELIRDIARRAD